MLVTYMNGAGNDFMVIDARGKSLDLPALAVKFCGLTGADGFMAADVSDKADFRLHFYNSDGTRGRCAAMVPAASAGLPTIITSQAKKWW